MRFDDDATWTARLGAHRPRDDDEPPADTPRHAAVAALLRRSVDGEVEVLLMQRSERPDDRWSGQISLPGGKREPDDTDLVATAVRETHEELGILLDDAHAARLCRLERLGARARGRIVPMTITPYVFAERRVQTVRLGPEAADHFWFPLSRAAVGELDHEYVYVDGLVRRPLPAWRHDEHVVWGLTHRILTSLIAALRGA